MTRNPYFRRPDAHVLLDALDDKERQSATTLQLSQILGFDVHRVARGIHQLVTQGEVEQHVRRPDGWAWRITEVGQASLDRCREREDGVRRPPRPDPMRGLRYAAR